MQIKEITADKPVQGQFLILENQLRVAKNGYAYLALKIGDPTGELAVKIWSADEDLYQQLEVGRVISVDGIQPKTYRDQIQLDWDGKNRQCFAVVAENEVDYARFLPHTPGNTAEYWDYLSRIFAGIREPLLQKTLSHFFDNPVFRSEFLRVPAALKRHHAYIGGLLEHTAGVVAMCEAAASYYPLVNRDLLLTGAALHDIGKVRTYHIGKTIEGTEAGKLLGHLVLGVEMVREAFGGLSDPASVSPDAVKIQNSLIHLLVSHHGIMEWGSPVEPLTLEACILHHADNMDAQVTKFLTVIRGHRSGGEWAIFDTGLGRSVYLGNFIASQVETSSGEED